jgi:hypothetical protein
MDIAIQPLHIQDWCIPNHHWLIKFTHFTPMVEGIRGGLVPRKWKQTASIGWAAWCQLRFLQQDNESTLIVFHFNFRITAQLLSSSRDVDNRSFGTQQYASFDWNDLWAIAPWMQEIITKKINGAGLGNWVHCNNDSVEILCDSEVPSTQVCLSIFVTHLSALRTPATIGFSLSIICASKEIRHYFKRDPRHVCVNKIDIISGETRV